MSLYLGKVHFWLYKKILWFETIEENIIKWAKDKNLPIEHFIQEVYERYGRPTGGEPLEEVIDTSNIHGWLQGKIASAESRQAAIITKILELDADNDLELMNIYKEKAIEDANGFKDAADSPQDIYNALNDFILEGMPCDRINEIVESNDEKIEWIAAQCVHKQYWDIVHGDVDNFYNLREVWIKNFVENLNSNYKYEKLSNGTRRIKKFQ